MNHIVFELIILATGGLCSYFGFLATRSLGEVTKGNMLLFLEMFLFKVSGLFIFWGTVLHFNREVNANAVGELTIIDEWAVTYGLALMFMATILMLRGRMREAVKK